MRFSRTFYDLLQLRCVQMRTLRVKQCKFDIPFTYMNFVSYLTLMWVIPSLTIFAVDAISSALALAFVGVVHQSLTCSPILALVVIARIFGVDPFWSTHVCVKEARTDRQTNLQADIHT